MSILPLQQHYADHLPAAFYQEVIPSGIGDAQWLIINHQLANALAIDINDHQADLLDVFAGNRLADPNKKPIAMAYAGHQFGHYVPMLGDGRGVLLGEIVVDNGSSKERWDLHLKGAGTTPYSRHGEGRAVLR
ncbi:hypothetical protein GYB62_02350, partial [bacterium]|nr:hypothetical protein [bacterium]